jgi:hypothetical protein
MVQVDAALPVSLINDVTETGPVQQLLVATGQLSNGGALCVQDNVMSSDSLANTGTHCEKSCVDRNRPAANNIALKSK